MKFYIKDMNYVNPKHILLAVMEDPEVSSLLKMALLKGQEKNNHDNLIDFDDLYYYHADGYEYDYAILLNKDLKQAVIVRDDNFEVIDEDQDILNDLEIKRIIKNKDKTIMLFNDNDKVIVTKHAEDKDDVEKAVMLCLLKRYDINYSDIEAIVRSIKVQDKPEPEVKKTKVKKNGESK